MATRSVRFFYYLPYITIDEKAFLEWQKSNAISNSEAIDLLNQVMESSKKELIFSDFEKIIDAVILSKINAFQRVKGKSAEVDLNAIRIENDLKMFQITNFRDTDIPAKKKPGQKREDIPLDDDEYIGEFMSVLYHLDLKVLMVQSNQYALSKKQLEDFFMLLFLAFYSLDNTIASLLSFELRPVIDNNMLKKINKQGIVDKLTIKGSDSHLSSITNNTNSALYNMHNILNSFAGVDFEITVKATVNKKKKKVDGLDKSSILEILPKYMAKSDAPKNLPSITTRYREDIDSPATDIEWLLPRMESFIRFTVEPKKTLGYEYVFDKMYETFKGEVENRLISICTGK